MRRRMYYVMPDLPSARRIMDDLLLARIEELKQTLRYAVQSPKRWPSLLRRALFARAIMA